MQQLPHNYSATATGRAEGGIPLTGTGLPTLETTAPPEFGGPEGYWSPETLLVGTVANCFILTFRAISRKAGMEWQELHVDVQGELDKTAEGLRFTKFSITAKLAAPGADEKKARELLEKSEKHCLVTASLRADTTLEASVAVE